MASREAAEHHWVRKSGARTRFFPQQLFDGVDIDFRSASAIHP